MMSANSAMIDYNSVTGTYRAAVEARLDAITSRRVENAVLSDAMRYSVLNGGKRLRAMLLLEAFGVAGSEPDERALDFACAMEMIHAYSLIHDDLPAMDNDDMRRGKPSNHVVFGEAMAILAGDALLNLAYEVMLSYCGSPDAAQAAAVVAGGAGCMGMVAGQAADILAMDGSMEALRSIHSLKTGALITASLVAGAVLGGGSPELLESLRTYGECFGLLFQITDDILDICGSEAELGKSIGKDAVKDKLTYPRLCGVERSRELAAVAADGALDGLSRITGNTEWLEETVRRTLVRVK